MRGVYIRRATADRAMVADAAGRYLREVTPTKEERPHRSVDMPRPCDLQRDVRDEGRTASDYSQCCLGYSDIPRSSPLQCVLLIASKAREFVRPLLKEGSLQSGEPLSSLRSAQSFQSGYQSHIVQSELWPHHGRNAKDVLTVRNEMHRHPHCSRRLPQHQDIDDFARPSKFSQRLGSAPVKA